MLILNRQAERKIGEQLLMIQKAKHRLVKEEDSPELDHGSNSCGFK